MRWLLSLPWLAGAAMGAEISTPAEAAEKAIDFAKEIQPIFEANCIKCHGPEKQKGGYRLDDRKSAMTGGDDHAPNIVPGKSAESPLIRFVAGLDPDLKMPKKGDPLTAEQIAVLRRWVGQGAVWPEGAVVARRDPLDWWSLRRLVRPAVPAIAGARNPIDAFIREKLAQSHLSPAPAADRRTLIRRVSYDLTGLPPSPEEVVRFVADEDPGAYEKLVNRLLDSPRYGERWARHWLDVVHYGDTHGYDKDKLRPNAWPYRDYVVQALNRDKPYARFVEEQIAGDALYPATDDGHNALGFIAAGPWDFIGHAELGEEKLDGKIARLLDRDDMVSNTMNTFCALTVQCARCHNHKFDPVSQEDYYRLQAVFAALDRADQQFDSDPAVARRRAELAVQKSALEKRRKVAEAKREAAGGEKLELLERLIAEFQRGKEAEERPEFGFHSGISASPDEVKWVQVDLGAPVALERIVQVACHDTFNGIGAGFGYPRRFRIEISDDASFATGVTLLEDETAADVTNPGVTPRTITAGGRTARYIRITATKLALRLNDYIFALAEVQAFDTAGRNVALGAAVTSSDSTNAPPRWQRKNLVDGYYYGHKSEASPQRIAALQQEREVLLAARPADATASELTETTRAAAEVDRALAALPPPKTVYSGIVYTGSGAFAGTGAKGGQPRPICVLKRGDVRQPGEEVGPGTVAISPDLPSRFDVAPDQPESARRVALARWITEARNPLTWRVIVNRVWQYHFGRGLSDSPNDFGRMGQVPTHPELLDWLAVEFRDGGGSLKKLHRLILLSDTYRQASAGNPEAEKIDAGNALLWRSNRRKLDAEAIRDSLLQVAGKLDLTMGGPGFQDFVIQQPEHSPHYEYALRDIHDPATFRRSIYRFIVRSQPQPFMTALDCADPSVSVDKRNESVNVLQALAFRNDRLTIAMAEYFAERVQKTATDPEAQVQTAFELALQRAPSLEEVATIAGFVRERGLVNACRLILNLNEFAFID